MIFSSPTRRRFAAFLAFWLLLSPSGLVGAATHSAFKAELTAGITVGLTNAPVFGNRA